MIQFVESLVVIKPIQNNAQVHQVFSLKFKNFVTVNYSFFLKVLGF